MSIRLRKQSRRIRTSHNIACIPCEHALAAVQPAEKFMSYLVDLILNELRTVVHDLGRDGGLISPSVYDTAQVLRLYPPPGGTQAVLEWLLEQRQSDGGWGDPTIPSARDVPTLASILALYAYGHDTTARDAVAAGLAFLHRQAEQWTDSLADDIPVGVELLLPRLVEEATTVGLALPLQAYSSLIRFGLHRRTMIARAQPRANTPAIHSWEAWGAHPDPQLVDPVGGVGNSPAATAAWLCAAGPSGPSTKPVRMAQGYLIAAAAATQSGIPGVVPTVWPISRFEQAFALFSLFNAGLLTDKRLHDQMSVQLNDLAQALGARGLGMSDSFLPDGDNTAIAIAVLRAAGYPVDLAVLRQFETADHFSAYVGEQQPSLSLTAHALHALNLFGETPPHVEGYVLQRQRPDGRWPSDKWHSSWLYTTGHVMLALHAAHHGDALHPAVNALLAHQHLDGGWGIEGTTAEETAYAVLALHHVQRQLKLPQIDAALGRAKAWLLDQYRPFAATGVKRWIGKETYHPFRIARAFELSALLTLLMEHEDE